MKLKLYLIYCLWWNNTLLISVINMFTDTKPRWCQWVIVALVPTSSSCQRTTVLVWPTAPTGNTVAVVTTRSAFLGSGSKSSYFYNKVQTFCNIDSINLDAVHFWKQNMFKTFVLPNYRKLLTIRLHIIYIVIAKWWFVQQK